MPLLEHALYQQIAATPGARKSNAVKAPPSSPTTAKPVQKLVIRRPGEAAPPATPAAPPTPPPPAPKPPVVEETPELEMIDVDLSFEPEPTPAPAPPPAPVAPPAAKRPTPPPAPPAPAPPAPPPPRVSAPRVSVPSPTPAAARASSSVPVAHGSDEEGASGSKKWPIIAAVVVLAAAGGAFAMLRGNGEGAVAPVESAAIVAPAVAIDSAAVSDSARVDSTAPAVAVVDTTPSAVAPGATPDTLPAAAAIPGVLFAPPIERGSTSWNARPATALPLSIPELEAVRLRYLAAQTRALEQFEAGLGAVGFADMFDPSRIGRQDRREESLEAVAAGQEALQSFRRRQAAIDFAYTDTLRQALPAGSDDPDLRTFGPILRESATQAAQTDSLLASVSDIYILLVGSPGGFTLRGRELFFQDAAKGAQYQVLQERLTAQLGRLRNRPVSDVPPAMGAVLRGIGLPR